MSAVAQTRPADGSDRADLTVFYDGACPLCRREVAFYRERRGAERVDWVDVSEAGTKDVAPGLSRQQALARFHVSDASGTLMSGGAAFAALWRTLPSFRPLGRLFGLRPFAWALERLYLVFLRLRPRLQALAARNESRPEAGFPDWLVRDLRSDHAGETGAVAIYRGILAVSRDSAVRDFAQAHMATERRHLELMDASLSPKGRSVFLPIWRVAGFLTGALPALFGREAVFATIDAVETFVDHHYAEQIERLDREGIEPALRDMLEACRQDEVDHRDEARDAAARPATLMLRLWCRLVVGGSAAAVALARRA